MKKTNFKILIRSINAVIVAFIFNTSFAESLSTEFIYGKVVYSDNFTPVEEGNIRVIIYDGKGEGRIIETVAIQNEGSFRITKKPLESTDGIKIMAYPNDIDNSEDVPYEATVVEASNILTGNKGQEILTIKVERIRHNINKSQGYKDSEKESKFILMQNFPNPFNPSTLITFNIPQTSNVTLKVYNMNGESVSTLVDNKYMVKGSNTLEFNAGSLPSGIYVYSLQAGEFSETRKMMLLK
ncbi:MAG: T9SS type A sorting domain-containing protein [Ignavibacteria bacterium]